MENKSWVIELETDPETEDLILPLNDAIIKEWKKEPFQFDEDLAVSLLKEHFGVKE